MCCFIALIRIKASAAKWLNVIAVKIIIYNYKKSLIKT